MSETTGPDKHEKTVFKLLLTVVFMFGFGYALVPLYDVFCDITGLNGKTGQVSVQAAQAGTVDTERTVTVEFVATVNQGLNWQFKPVTHRMIVHPGQIYTVDYVAENPSTQPITAQAVPSVAPGRGGIYFNKTECFCFTQQTLAAGERKLMPVRFVVDPLLPGDISTLTLSYTFFKSKT